MDVKVLLQCVVGGNSPIRVGLLCGQHGCLGRGGIERTFTKVHDRGSPKQPDTANQHCSSRGVPCHVFSPSTTRAHASVAVPPRAAPRVVGVHPTRRSRFISFGNSKACPRQGDSYVSRSSVARRGSSVAETNTRGRCMVSRDRPEESCLRGRADEALTINESKF